jgi:protein-disulfide isomerase
MIRKRFLTSLVAAVALSASAAPTNLAALRGYATKALASCPDATITLEPIEQPGPAGFIPYRLTEKSSDPSCGREAFLLHSPATGQVIIGTVFALPFDNRSAEVRVAEAASALMHQELTASITRFPLPDGLHAVSITKQTRSGPFAYHGYIDASQQFLLVGSRGSLYMDPGTNLVESLGIENAVRRGNPKARVKIIEMSDFECPVCARAHKEVEPLIAKHLSKIDYYRLDLPLFENHEWALPAALGARAVARVAPAKYWAYVNFMFGNQDAIGKSRSFTEVLKNFCEDHDIDWKRVDKIYSSPAEQTTLLDQVSRAFDSGINSTPTYVVNGQILGYGPNGKFTVDAIKRALGAK